MQRIPKLKDVLDIVVLCWATVVPLAGISLKSYRNLYIRTFYVGILMPPSTSGILACTLNMQ